VTFIVPRTTLTLPELPANRSVVNVPPSMAIVPSFDQVVPSRDGATKSLFPPPARSVPVELKSDGRTSNPPSVGPPASTEAMRVDPEKISMAATEA
jgi:hypothetical protein